MLKAGNSVAAVATELGVSEPTVYNAIRRLDLTLPSKSKAKSSHSTQRERVAAATTTSEPNKSTSKKAPARSTRTATPNASTPTLAVGSDTKQSEATMAEGTAKPRAASKRPKGPAVTDNADVPINQTTPGTGLVPIGPDTELLTFRVDKGIELLKNLSARIVRHERELAAARQRYAETLASLALS